MNCRPSRVTARGTLPKYDIKPREIRCFPFGICSLLQHFAGAAVHKKFPLRPPPTASIAKPTPEELCELVFVDIARFIGYDVDHAGEYASDEFRHFNAGIIAYVG